MTGHRLPDILAISDRVYNVLLKACPATYRDAYGALMAQAFRDLARAAYRQDGTWGIVLLWWRILPDICAATIAEHVAAFGERRAAKGITPVGRARGGYVMGSTLPTTGTWAISTITLLIGLFCVWPLYLFPLCALGGRLLAGDIFSSPLFTWTRMPFLLWKFAPTVLISDLGRYVALSIAGIFLALAALRFGRRSRVLRAAEVLTLVGILALPWLYRYHPPVEAAPGRVLLIPTQPGLLEGVAKRAQVSIERTSSSYHNLGWSAEGVLYYQEIDEAGEVTTTWAYSPEQDAQAQLVVAPGEIVRTAAAPRDSLLELVRSPTWPASAERSSRSLKIREDGLASPDGRWAAAVAKHIYGPEDIIVVALE